MSPHGALAALLTIWVWSGSSAAPAASVDDRGKRIAQLASELRTGDPWPKIRRDRIRTLLPRAMEAARVDAWVVFCRENNNDPLAKHVGGEHAGGLTALLFLRRAGGMESIVVAPKSEIITLGERLPYARLVSIEGGRDPIDHVADELRKAGSLKIAVNKSALAAADGLTATHHEKLVAALGPNLAGRLTSSEELVIRWLGVKLPAEIEIMRKAAVLTDLIEYEAFETVVPGQTTNGDLRQAIRIRIEGLGIGHSWPDNPGITTGLDRGRGSDLKRVIKPGDLIDIDAGVKVYDVWCTDIQRFAYVLKPGETAPPPEIQHAWESARQSSRKMLAAMRPGVAGWEVDKVQVEWQEARGSLKHWAGTGHPVGYWTHDVGPSLSGYSKTTPPSARSQRRLEVGMVFGYDGNFVWAAEDDGVKGTKSITIEEMGLVTANGGEYLCPPQEELVFIPKSN